MRPFHHNSNMGRGGGDSTGPLLTEHLRDLDLELELLKRKREMIEKQQSLLNQQQAFNLQSFSFDQPQSFRDQHYDDGPQYNSNRDFSSSNRDYSTSSRDFSHLYDEPPQSRDRFPRQSAKKRLGDYVWSDPPMKRSYGGPPNKFGPGPANKLGSGPPNKFGPGPAKKFGSGPSPKQNKFVPPSERHSFAKNQPGKPKPSERFKAPPRPVKPKPTDFKPTKVVKAKTAFVNKASTFVPKPFVANTAPKADLGVKPILQADQAPTPQMAGRLELALGNILKVVKDKYGKDPQYKPVFSETMTNKGMKQEIRDRIRKVMVGKPVGHVPEIIKMYREVYPDSTDKEIVEIGMQKKMTKPTGEFKLKVVTERTLSPYAFFKRNFTQLLSHSLNKMFSKIDAISKEETLKRQSEEGNNATTSTEVTAPAEAVKTDSNETYIPEMPTEENVSEEQQGEDVTEKSKGEDVTEKSKGEDVTEKSKGEDVTEKSKGEDVTEKSKGEDVTEKSKGEDVSEEPKDDSGLNEESKEDATENTNGENITENPEESKGLENSTQNIKYPLDAVRAQYDRMINEMMPKKLAFWLPKLKGKIMNALEADYDFQTMKKQIVAETEARLNKRQNPETSTPETKKPAAADAKRQKLKYYVKIQGRPMLPKKPLMQPFLDQFNPKVVKKIKSLRNLLFVGFESKADFDRIVAANGTMIGNDKIIVKISQWVTSEALNAPAETTSTPNTSAISDGDVTKDAYSNDVSVLNTSLDNQIDELLTSIRNEEEAENSGKQDGGEENINVDENAEAENGENVSPDDAENTNVDENAEAENGENVSPDDSENTNVDENAEAENGDNVAPGDDNVEEAGTEEAANNENGTEEVQESTENNDQEKIEAEAKDKVEELKTEAKESGRATPTRASNRLATSTPTTPSTIRTRRASRLAQN